MRSKSVFWMGENAVARGVTALIVLVLASSKALGVGSAPAHADGELPGSCSGLVNYCAGAEVRNGGVASAVVDGYDVPALITLGREHSPASCEYYPPPDGFDQRVDVANTSRIPARAVYYIKSCEGSEEWHWYVPSSPVTSDVDAQALVGRAFGEIRPPEPSLVTSPPLGAEVLTGLPMYLAVDDVAFSERSGSVSAGQFTVTAVVRPIETRFVPGDQHDAFACDGPGSTWSHGDRPTDADCTHTYTHTPTHLGASGASYELMAQVIYEASYTVEGPILAGTYELGRFDGPENVVEVPVIERRAVRTAAGG
jgi:hypothetical protein